MSAMSAAETTTREGARQGREGEGFHDEGVPPKRGQGQQGKGQGLFFRCLGAGAQPNAGIRPMRSMHGARFATMTFPLRGAEVYSRKRVSKIAEELKLTAGEAMDLKTGRDLSESDVMHKARRVIQRGCPDLIIGCHPCMGFSALQQMSQKKWLC